MVLILMPGLLWADDEESKKKNIVDYVGKHSQLRIDAKTLENTIGLDYQFNISISNIFNLKQDFKDAINWGVELESKGYLAGDRSKNELDSTVTAIKIVGYSFKVSDAPSDTSPGRCKELLAKNPDAIKENPQEYKEIQECIMGVNKRVRFFSWDGHAKYEATQDFDSHDTAAGLGISFDFDSLISGFANILDYPFSWLRDDPKKMFRAESPRVYVGYDYVTGLKDTDREQMTGNKDTAMNRVTAQVAWRTLVLDKLIIRLLYQVYWEPNAPAEIKAADRDFNKLLEVSYSYPTGDKSTFIVKYSRGELPPNFNKASEMGIGWSVAFQ
jgi:hypothetical protein